MRRTQKATLWLSTLVLVAGLSPLRSDGGTECSNVTTSLSAQVNNPVAGDEAFFKLPSGPSNVMLLLDNSGSMQALPQCDNYGQNDFGSSGTGACDAPALVTPNATSQTVGGKVIPGFNATDNEIGSFLLRGTCLPATDANLASSEKNPGAAWMEAITPSLLLPDPGHTSTSLMNDAPPWAACPGSGSNGNKCLFDKDAYYAYGQWNQTSATRIASDVDTSLVAGCKYRVNLSTGTRDLDMGPLGCTSCMTNHGYYFFTLRYATSVNSSGAVTNSSTSGAQYRFKGTFLNANPPKYVTARFVVKDVAWIGTASKPADEIRLGLTILQNENDPRGGTLVVPLGPNRASSFPYYASNFTPVRQAIIDAVNGVRANGTTAPGAFTPYGGNTPIGSAMFNIGQYFAASGFYTQTTTSSQPCQVSCTYAQRNTTPSQCQSTCLRVSGTGTGSSATYRCASKTLVCPVTTPVLGGTGPYDQGWAVSSFAETAKGTVNASWAQTGNDSSGNPLQCTTCWACQKNSVVIVTDGMPNSEITFPTQITSNATINADYTAACGASPACNGANAPKVAEWLNTTELRPGMGQGAKHALTFHTVGFAVTDTGAQNTLRAIASMGKGTSAFAVNKDDVLTAVWAAVNTATPKETSFSAASANSLQTIQTAASDAYLTRFLPSDLDPAWEGHLFQGSLFDEFLNGCDTTKTPAQQAPVTCPTGTPISPLLASFGKRVDSSGNALCDGVYLIDRDCDIIVEDSGTGFFIKETNRAAANFPWDAGEVLSNSAKAGYKGANARNIFTWIGTGKVDLTTANVATLKPYLNIDTLWCTKLLTDIHVSGGTDPTTVCANQIINFVRGWDVMDFDGDGCGGPGRSTNPASCANSAGVVGGTGAADGEERNRANDSRTIQRFWKLGDIFHSSPAVVTAPIDAIRCDTGYEKQCVATLRSPASLPLQTSNPSTNAGLTSGSANVDAYERYRLDNRQRRRVVLVGANDGMLHAFDAGLPSSCDAHGVCSYTAGSGTGEELWAFIPPDLLPRLKDMMTNHQYMVDGSVMVRDVWVDGGALGASTKDHVKQSNEFHTVAIFGERSGGTQYTALDVTTPDDYTKVKMLWTFPQPLSVDAFYMGQSWADFAPRPPPIGPVRIADSTDTIRNWSEQWIVMINGGYDPAMTRGRAVFMVDAWTGATLWRYTNDTFKTQLGYSDSGASMFPVAAGIALLDIGEPSNQTFDSDGFFDTATWGDLGGNLFVGRFWEPGIRDQDTGLVTNWWAARTFEERRQTDSSQIATGRSEFYYMTSNAFEPNTRSLRTFVGSGNRERLMQQGAACGPDNLLACCQSGCAVTSTTTDNFGACSVGNTFSCTSAGVMTQASTTSTCGATAVCSAPTKSVSLNLNCGVGQTSTPSGSITCNASGICATITTSASGVQTSTPYTPIGTNHDVTPPGAVSRNRFYGIWSYGGIASKTFSSQATARSFDATRFTDTAYSGTCSGTRGNSCSLVDTTYAQATYAVDPRMPTVACSQGSTCTAQSTDPGWYYEYGRSCPATSCSDPTWNDEKTGSGSSVVLGCAVWSGLRPYGKSSGGDPCTNLATPVTYGYLADYVSGAPTAACGYVDATTKTLYRATQRSTTAPPSSPLVRVTVNVDGKVSYSTLQLDSGAPPANKQIGTRNDLFEPVYWLEVPRDLHNCRHTATGSCE
jgi:hypothetical protein